ncbi:MAG TPA: YidC/Oxa1 family membrane protein insertase [Solirubrobacteraceae bacterium]|nr:YidC/Oxa1 family membrane protein insertase [Solirubrobacteraceae bacterium]
MAKRVPVEVASLRRRAFAALVDLVVILAGIDALLVLVVKRKARRLDRDQPRRATAKFHAAATFGRRAARLYESKPGQVLLHVISITLVEVPLRNWRSPGARIAGIRVVDARTGGPVTVRSAILGEEFGKVFGLLIRPLTNRLRRRSEADRARLRELQPQIESLGRQYADDGAARQKAIMDLYKAHHVNPLGSTLWTFPGVLLMPLTALFSPTGQTLRQRVSGTLVIRAR